MKNNIKKLISIIALFIIVYIGLPGIIPLAKANYLLNAPDEIWIEKNENGLYVRWTNVKNNDGYIIKIDDQETKLSKDTVRYNVTNIFTEARYYQISIKTLGGDKYGNSPFSDVFNHQNKLKLKKPSALNVNEKKVLSWIGDNNASGYELVINGVLVSNNIKETSYDLSNYLLNASDYDIRINSIGSEFYFDSGFTESFIYKNKMKLETPINLSVVSIGGKIIFNWQKVPYAKSYKILIDNEIELIENDNTLDISEYVRKPKIYNISVTAIGYDYFLSSNAEILNYKSTVQLAKPKLVIDGETVIWDEIPNSITYTVTINDTIYNNTEYTQTKFNFSPYCMGAGKYIIKVTANGYGNYDASETAVYEYLKYSKLDTPKLEIKNKILCWNAVRNATNYTLYIDGKEINNLIYETTFDLTEFCVEAKNYEISVKANNNGYFIESQLSQIIFVNKVKLDSPNITVNEYFVKWQEIWGAESYTITINGKIVCTNCDNLEFDLTDYLSKEGEYKIGVFANAHGNYIESDTTFITIPIKNEDIPDTKTYRLMYFGVPIESSEDYLYFIDGEKFESDQINSNGEITLPYDSRFLDIALNGNSIQFEGYYKYFQQIDLSKANKNGDIYEIDIFYLELHAGKFGKINEYKFDSLQYFIYEDKYFSFHYIEDYTYYPEDVCFI